MIDIQKLNVSYGRGTPVLKALELQLAAGSITALAAPNGEGKTTLLKAICGLKFPDSGKLNVLGFTPNQRSAAFLQQVYYLPAEPSFPNWTPKKIGKYYGAFYPSFKEASFVQCLEDFKVDHNKPLGKLSFGQQRRAQLAFALAVGTPLLLLDEPTLGLDIAGKDQFRRSLIKSTEANQTVIIATHQLSEVAPILDNMLILQSGKIHSQINIAVAFERLSFSLSTSAPEPFDGSYGRRVPGGWLIVKEDINAGNTTPDLETLYLALTEGDLQLGKLQKTN